MAAFTGLPFRCPRCLLIKEHKEANFRPVVEIRKGEPYHFIKHTCRKCELAARSESRRNNRDRDNAKRRCENNYEFHRRNNLKKNYGITPEQYDAMLASQGGVCAVCRQEKIEMHRSGRAIPLAVDHDHATGIVRGLLCSQCNRGLGDFKESELFLQNAINYLRQHHG